MRSCVYCGRTLEKDEKCSCPQSVRARNAKNNAYTNNESSENTFNETYTTGYTKKEKKNRFSKLKNFWKERKLKRNTGGVGYFISSFLKEPVNTIASPPYLNSVGIILIALVAGMVLAGGGYFLSSLFGGVINILSQSFAIPVLRTYSIGGFLFTAVFGGLALALSIFVVFSVFWCIDRFILKRATPFFAFVTRLSYAILPVVLLGIVGIVIGFFSLYALLMFYVAGIVMWIILTYEALGYEWSFMDKSRIFYFVTVGLVFALIIGFNILRF